MRYTRIHANDIQCSCKLIIESIILIVCVLTVDVCQKFYTNIPYFWVWFRDVGIFGLKSTKCKTTLAFQQIFHRPSVYVCCVLCFCKCIQFS